MPVVIECADLKSQAELLSWALTQSFPTSDKYQWSQLHDSAVACYRGSHSLSDRAPRRQNRSAEGFWARQNPSPCRQNFFFVFLSCFWSVLSQAQCDAMEITWLLHRS